MSKEHAIRKPILRFILPKREVVQRTSNIACMHCYYIPLFNRLYRRRITLLCELIGNRRYRNILDIGFGGGILFPTISQVAQHIIGVDPHSHHHSVTKLMIQHYGLNPFLVRGRLPYLPFTGRSFEAIISLSNFYYLGDQLRPSLDEIRRIAQADTDIYLGTSSRGFYSLVLKKTAYRNFPPVKENVLNCIKERFTVEEIKTIPSFMPPALSIYFSCRCRIKD